MYCHAQCVCNKAMKYNITKRILTFPNQKIVCSVELSFMLKLAMIGWKIKIVKMHLVILGP